MKPLNYKMGNFFLSCRIFFSRLKLDSSIIMLISAAATLFLISTYTILPALMVFGHDEVHYYKNFGFKLREDGRWINFILHDFLRAIPPGVWAVLLLSACWLFIYRVCQQMKMTQPISILVAATVLVTPPFIEQSLWPATSITAILALLAIEQLSKKGVPYQFLYLGAGIVIFGCLQSFYFLVPLAQVGHFLTTDSDKAKLKLLFQHLSWWVLGSIVGVLFMSTLLYLATHHFGVQVASWRQAQPVHNFDSLISNIGYVAKSFWSVLISLFRGSNISLTLIAVALFVVITLGARTIKNTWPVFVLLIAVLISFFAFSVPLAPVIQMRSLEAMVTAIVLLLALLAGESRSGKFILTVLLAMFCMNFSNKGIGYLAKHKQDTEFIRSKILQVIPNPPGTYQAITIYGELEPVNVLGYIFNSPPRMVPIVNSINANGFHDCRSGFDKYCEKINSPKEISSIPFAQGFLTFSVSKENIGVISYHKN